MTLNKERLEEIKLRAETQGINANYTPDEILAMTDRLLSGQDPVAWTDEEELRDLRKVGFCEMFTVEPISKDVDPLWFIPLYREAPQPVEVPDLLIAELLEIAKNAANEADECAHFEHNDDSERHAKAIADWQRRAAMLQPSSGALQLPDDTKRLDWLDAQNKRLNEYYGTSYGWKFDANFQRNAMMLNDSNYPVMNVRRAIDEAMRTAPQEPTK